MLLLANLGVARALVSCEPASGNASLASHAAPGDAHDDHSQHGSPEQGRSDAPESAECCQAMTSCTSAGDLTAASVADSKLDVSTSVESTSSSAPIARTVAPEPPPPRG